MLYVAIIMILCSYNNLQSSTPIRLVIDDDVIMVSSDANVDQLRATSIDVKGVVLTTREFEMGLSGKLSGIQFFPTI